MPWLQSFAAGPPVEPGILVLRLGLAFLLGFVVAWLYRATNGGEAVPSFRATLVLLTILIAAVTQVIGDNVARAFSLVGALSIVRFRTVVQNTRDTAFVIFAVTLGMAVGAGDWRVALAALAFVGLAAALVAPRARQGWGDAAYNLSVTVTLGYEVQEVVREVWERRVEMSTVTSVASAARGAAIETVFEVRLKQDAQPTQVVDELNALEGVQDVQLRRVAAPG